jgi:hypothetical protein
MLKHNKLTKLVIIMVNSLVKFFHKSKHDVNGSENRQKSVFVIESFSFTFFQRKEHFLAERSKNAIFCQTTSSKACKPVFGTKGKYYF